MLFSDYGFTESNAHLQKKYLAQLALHAKKGYLVCNFVPRHFRVRPLSKQRLLKNFEGLDYRIVPEEPKTGKDNFVLIWGRDV